MQWAGWVWAVGIGGCDGGWACWDLRPHMSAPRPSLYRSVRIESGRGVGGAVPGGGVSRDWGVGGRWEGREGGLGWDG